MRALSSPPAALRAGRIPGAPPPFEQKGHDILKHALDPHMIRHLSLEETCRKVADLGYDHVEMSPRPDFLSWWTRPKVWPERIASFRKALKDHGLGLGRQLAPWLVHREAVVGGQRL